MKSITPLLPLSLALAVAPPAAWPESNAAGGLPALEQRVAALEAAAGGGGASEIAVACPGESLAEALAGAAHGVPVSVTVSGRCAGPVVIDRDGVLLQGTARGDGVDGELRIVGAQRVTVRNLTVENLNGTAVDIREGASATLEDVTAVGDFQSAPNSGAGGYGVTVTRQAFAQLDRVDARVLSGGNNALLLTDGATVRTRDGSYVSQSQTSFDNTTIGLYRQASLRMDGAPVIENLNDLGGGQPFEHLALQVLHTSNFRLHHDAARIGGNVHVGNNSAAFLRRIGGPAVGPGVIEGNVTINGDSHLQIGTRLNATVTEYLLVDDQSLLSVQGPPASVQVQGGVFCTGPNLDGGVRGFGALASPPDPRCSRL